MLTIVEQLPGKDARPNVDKLCGMIPNFDKDLNELVFPALNPVKLPRSPASQLPILH